MDWLQEAKTIVLPHRELATRLVADFLSLRGAKLRTELDKHKATIGQVWLALFAISLVLDLVALYVDPLTRPTGDIPTILRQVAFSGSALWIPGILPIYLAIRLFDGAKCFWLLLVVNQIASCIVCAAMCLTVLPGVYLSTQLAGDIEEVRAGRGQNTPFYHIWCAPTKQKILVLSEQIELNRLTGKYDLLERLQKLPPQSSSGFSQIKEYDARIEKLPAKTKMRVNTLTADIDARQFASIESRDPFEDIAQERYWPTFVGYCIFLLINFTLIIFEPIVIYRAVYSSCISKRTRRLGALRVTIGTVTSIIFTFLFMSLSTGWQFSTDYYDLKSRTLSAEVSARSVQNVCGRIDSRGLW